MELISAPAGSRVSTTAHSRCNRRPRWRVRTLSGRIESVECSGASAARARDDDMRERTRTRYPTDACTCANSGGTFVDLAHAPCLHRFAAYIDAVEQIGGQGPGGRARQAPRAEIRPCATANVPCALRNGPADVREHGRARSARLDAICKENENVTFDRFRGRAQRIARTSRIPPPQDVSFGRRAPQTIAHQPLRSRAHPTTLAFRPIAAGRPRAQDEPLVHRLQRPQRRRSVRRRRHRRVHEGATPVPRTQHHLRADI